MKISNEGVTIVALAGLIVAIVVTALAVANLSVPSCNGIGENHTFILVSNLDGYNESGSHRGQQWPILNVRRCDIVTVRLANLDPSQAHGLAVAYYWNSGVVAGPAQTIEIRFQVTRAGQFKVYCSILCTVHRSMQNGILNVE